jgi:hypothetical protein
MVDEEGSGRCEEARLDEWCRSGDVREKGAGRALPPLLAW